MTPTESEAITAWCEIFGVIIAGFGLAVTVVSMMFRSWSKRQDRAIKVTQDKLNGLSDEMEYHRAASRTLRGYIRSLLHILDTRRIQYPAPPAELYEDTYIPERNRT